ncbi:glycosyltransferase [uncultured Amaricoccus sp.]|uniref:glycosyltransferase n=1 Tax=uncultured Amaricoccus sp. TaxID=339341 RepID=UPI002601B76B|nr:glycosyltransferase [uncultured Amaricoccus sp.]
MARVLPFRPVAEDVSGAAAPRRPYLGQILVQRGAIAPAALAAALDQQRHQDTALGQILLVGGLISGDTLVDALAEQTRIGRIDLDARPADPAFVAEADPGRCLALEAVPWRTFGGRRVIAVANPAQGAAALEAFGGEALALAPAAAIRRTVARHFGQEMVRAAEARCPAEASCRTLFVNGFTLRKAVVLAVLAAGICWLSWSALAAVLVWALVSHAATVGLRAFALVARWRKRRLPPVAATSLAEHRRKPPVSLLVPLKGEAKVAGQLLAALRRMDYPEALLDIKLVLEAGDVATLAAIERAGMPPTVEVVTVPKGTVETKPRALNYALPFCRGEIVGVYDAEDAPDPGQIEAVVRHLMAADPKVGCVQGYLDFYNSGDNLLSRWFTIDYALWFRVVLVGVERLGLPIPLGGTTVFFRRRVLEEVGCWDAHNVTEDADLGMRLARHGYRCEMVATTTKEEACAANPWRWVGQRSRWLKGYAITWATHMRRPWRLWRDLGPLGFAGFQVLFLGGLTAFLAWPLYWFAAFGGLVGLPVADHLPPGYGTALAVALFAGLVVDWVGAAVALAETGRARMIPWIPTLLIYGLLGSLAAYHAMLELLYRPFHWLKTEHSGLRDGQP